MKGVAAQLEFAGPRRRASRDRVDVWALALEPDGRDADLLCLCDAERAFAARLRVGADRWVAARAALRRILGSHLGLAPERVLLEAGEHGKPCLALRAGDDLRFNLSHSGAVAVIAVRLGFEVGIDVEVLRFVPEREAIARDQFPEFERRGLPRAEGETTDESFLRCWVRREALAKATGRGIAAPPKSADAARFTVRDLGGIPGCVAAISSVGGAWRTVLHPLESSY